MTLPSMSSRSCLPCNASQPPPRLLPLPLLLLLLLLLGASSAAAQELQPQQQQQQLHKHEAWSSRSISESDLEQAAAEQLAAAAAAPHAGAPVTCHIIHSGSWGLTAILYVLIEGIPLLRLHNCSTCVYLYDHSKSPYQCPDIPPAEGLDTFLSTQLNKLPEGMAVPPPPPAKHATPAAAAARPAEATFDAPRCDEVHDLGIFDVIEVVRREHERRRKELGGMPRGAFEFGVPLGLAPELNAARLQAQREVHAASCPMVRALWRPSGGVKAEMLDALRARLGALPQPLVAIHVRGGDKLFKEVPREYQDALLEGGRGPYAEGAMQLLAQHPEAADGTCVIVGDDWMLSMWVAASVKPLLRCHVVNNIQPDRHGHFQAAFNRADLHRRCEETKRLIADVDLLAWANFTIGTVHSNVDELAHRVSKCVYGRAETSYVDAMGWDMVTAYPRIMN